MRPACETNFVPFSVHLEGEVFVLYQDVKSLVTTAIGKLVPFAYVGGIPLRRSDGTLATVSEKQAEWTMIANAPGLAQSGWRAAARIATLHLDAEGVLAITKDTLAENVRVLRRFFPDYDAMGADAQLLLHSLAWANGEYFASGYPKFTAAANAGDWRATVAESGISTKRNPGIVPRNVADTALCANAAAVLEQGLDPDVLYFPKVLDTGASIPGFDAMPSADYHVSGGAA